MTCQMRFSLYCCFSKFKLFRGGLQIEPKPFIRRAPSRARTRQTRRRFGGRQPLCGIGVTSLMWTLCKPDDASARTADSRPEPGPFTRTSIDFMPYWSRATPAADAEACCAAYGVPLRDPLKPIDPAEDQDTARPSGPQMVMIVLLNVAWICATPCGTTRFSRFFLNSFLRFDGAFPGASVVAPCCGSFAKSVPSLRSGLQFRQFLGLPCRPSEHLLPGRDFLLCRDSALARTFARSRIRVRALA